MAKTKHLHERRGLSFAELGALLGVRSMLQSGMLKHAESRWIIPKPKEHLFNMSTVLEVTAHCGSTQCIAGAMAMILGMDQAEAITYAEGKKQDKPLGALFYPPNNYDYATITPKQAVKAIDNYLKDGKPRWSSILTKAQKDYFDASQS